MKRKLSLLMAAVMALSTLPFTATEVQASTNSIAGHTVTAVVPNNTVFVEATGTGDGNRANALRLPGNMNSPGTAWDWNPSGPSQTAPAVPYATQAGYLLLHNTSNTTIHRGATVSIELDNAEWFFRATDFFTTAGTGGFWNNATASGFWHGTGTASYGAGTGAFGFDPNVSGEGVAATTGAQASVANLFAQVLANPAFVAAGSPSDLLTGHPGSITANDTVLTQRLNEVLNAPRAALTSTGHRYHRIGSGIPTGATGAALQWIRTGTGAPGAIHIHSTYEPSRGIYLPMSAAQGAVGRYLRFGRYGVNPMPVPTWNSTGGNEVPYLLDISPIQRDGAYRRATLTVLEPVTPGNAVRIPLAIRVTSEDEVAIRVINEGFGGNFTTSRHLLVAGGAGATIAYVVNPEVSRDVFAIEQLVIRETRANSIRRIGSAGVQGNVSNANAFDLVLPPGFYFSSLLPVMSVSTTLPIETASTLRVGLESGGPGSLAWQGGRVGWGTPGTDFIAFWPAGYEERRNRLRVVMFDFEESFNSPGAIFLQNLVIHASEHAPFDVDIEIGIENTELVAPGGRFIGQSGAPQVVYTAPTGTQWSNRPTTGFIRPVNEGSNERYDFISNAVWFAADTIGLIGEPDEDVVATPAWMASGLAAAFRSPSFYDDWLNLQNVVMEPGWVSGGGASLLWNRLFLLAELADPTVVTAGSIDIGVFRPRGWFGRGEVTGASINANARNTVNMVTATTVRAGTRRDWGIILRTEGDVPELISGRYVGPTSWRNVNHQAARVVFEESVPNSWWAGRQVILTLPEEVRWRSVHFVDVVGTNESMALHNQTYVNFPGNTPLSGWVNAIPAGGTAAAQGVRFDDNRMYWNDVLAWRAQQVRNDRALLRFDSWLSIAAHFEGDIVLTASGTAVPREVYTVLPSTVVATALRPVRVNVVDGITDLRIGFQNQPTSTIILTEARTGALFRDHEVRLSVTDLLATDIGFTPDTEVQVTNQDASGLRIRGVNTGLSGSLFGFGDGVPSLGVADDRGTIAFTVDYASHLAPGEITISNVGVRVDRTVPETNEQPYWVVVWGTAIANNFGPFNPNPNESWIEIPFNERTNNDRFMQSPGIFVDYVRIVTGGDGSAPFSAEVRVTIGEPSVWVNDERFDMDVAPVLRDGNTFVPLRFVAQAFQIPERDITWTQENRSVTLILPQGRGVVQFFVDRPYVTINGGEPVSIVNAADQPVSPLMIVVDDSDGARMMLPFRFFGETILGVDVAWDQETQTAYFNPSARVRTHE